MRIFMLISSLLMTGTGAFCIANANMPFISLAAIIGIITIIMGIAKLFVSLFCKINADDRVRNFVRIEATLSIIIGIVFLSGQIVDVAGVLPLFALWTTLEGLKSISINKMNYRINSTIENISQILGIITTLFGLYIFFNEIIFDIRLLILVGISMMLIGLDCFKLSLQIEYKKSELLSSTKEKLEDAKMDEKEAMERAKEAMKESKEARERISKYTEELIKEETLHNKIGESRRKSKKYSKKPR